MLPRKLIPLPELECERGWDIDMEGEKSRGWEGNVRDCDILKDRVFCKVYL